MAEVSEINCDDFGEIYTKYLADDDKRLGRDDWERLFQCRCSAVEKPLTGYKLTHDNKVVGILGTIHSLRQIKGKAIPFCNLHSWFVDKEHRGSSLLLMRPILRLNDHVITDFSPTPAVIKISQRLGFRLFKIQQRILPFSAGKRLPNQPSSELIWNEAIDPSQLTPSDRRILEDHSNDRFARLLITAGNENTLLVVQRNTFHWNPYASVTYVSNPKLLLETQRDWQNAIRDKLSVKRIVGPAKYLDQRLSGSFRVPFSNVQLYRSDRVGPEMIDTLYTEVSELGLTTLPGIKSIVKNSAQALNPLNWFRQNGSSVDV